MKKRSGPDGRCDLSAGGRTISAALHSPYALNGALYWCSASAACAGRIRRGVGAVRRFCGDGR